MQAIRERLGGDRAVAGRADLVDRLEVILLPIAAEISGIATKASVRHDATVEPNPGPQAPIDSDEPTVENTAD